MRLPISARDRSVGSHQNARVEETTLIALNMRTHDIPAQPDSHLTQDLHGPSVPGLGQGSCLTVGGRSPGETERGQDEQAGRGFDAH